MTADTGLAAPLHAALTGAIAGMSTADRAGTRLSGIVRLPAGAYDAPVRTGPLLRDDPAA